MFRAPARPAAALAAALLAAGCSISAHGGQRADPPEPKATVATTTSSAPATTTPPPTTVRPSPTHPPRPRPTPSPKPRPTPSPTPKPAPKPPATPKSTGEVVVLDPGHNGGNASHPDIINKLVPAGNGTTKPCNTTGTATNSGYPEHAFNWDVASRVRTILRNDGITVVLTRPDDTGVGPCVNRRAEIGNDAHAAAVVSIHGDGSPTGHGFHIIRADNDHAGAATDSASSRLATDVHARMLTESGMTTATYIGSNGYDMRSDLAGLTLSVRPTIMIECGNMRDSGDAMRMSSPYGRAAIAAAIAAGITAFLAGH